MEDEFRTTFKSAYLNALDLLCSKLVYQLLGSYEYAKKEGVHARVTEYLEIALECLKIKPNEKFEDEDDEDDYEYSEETVRKFLTALASNAVLILAEENARASETSETSETNETTETTETTETETETIDLSCFRQWALDVIGGMIGEISIILDSPELFAAFFDSQYSSVEPNSNAETQLLTLIAHLTHRLKKEEADSTKISEFLTPSICRDLQTLVREKKISSRIRMLIEGRITKCLFGTDKGRMIKLSEIGTYLHSNMDKHIEKSETDQINSVISLGYTGEANFIVCGLPKFVPVKGADYLTAEGYRNLANALARGFNIGFPPFNKMSFDLQRQTICSIVYDVADQAEQFHKDIQVDDVANAIEGVCELLKAHCSTPKVVESLAAFDADIRLLNDEDRSYLWENPKGKENFSRICQVFDIKSVFAE